MRGGCLGWNRLSLRGAGSNLRCTTPWLSQAMSLSLSCLTYIMGLMITSNTSQEYWEKLAKITIEKRDLQTVQCWVSSWDCCLWGVNIFLSCISFPKDFAPFCPSLEQTQGPTKSPYPSWEGAVPTPSFGVWVRTNSTIVGFWEPKLNKLTKCNLNIM